MQLREAAESIALRPGQKVEVRRIGDGDLVVAGFIEEVIPDVRTIRVRDRSSGTDHQVDVDVDRYEVHVFDQDITGKAPHPPQTTLYLRPSRPGAYTGGRWGVSATRSPSR
jgi:hypothetical protein